MEKLCCAINLYEIRNEQSNTVCFSRFVAHYQLNAWKFIHLHISFESKRKPILGISTCSAQRQQTLSAHLCLERKKGGSDDSQVIALL